MNLQKKKGCIRFGHGQNSRGQGDPGACHGNLKEDDITLKTGLSVVYGLKEDYELVVPRNDDNWVDKTPEDRLLGIRKAIKVANDAGCVFLISIHVNSAASQQANGTEVVYLDDESKILAEKLSKAVSATLGLNNRGAKKDVRGLYELKHFKGKYAVILELGFLSNDKDRSVLHKLMQDKQLRIALANSISGVLKSTIK